jgi:hypothetical protein
MTYLARERLSLVGRIVAGTAGAYGVALAAGICVSFVAPLPRADAVLLGLLVSFLIFLAAVLAIFAHGSVTRIWIVLIGATSILGGVSWLIGPHSAP